MTHTTLYLIRHGQTDSNAREVIQGWLDSPLNAYGRQQAEMMAGRMRSAGIARVYSSPLRRAADTAHVLSLACGVPLGFDERLVEFNMGAFTGLNGAQVDAMQSAGRRRFDDIFDSTPPGGETSAEIRARVLSVLEHLLGDAAGSAIAVVSHGGTISAMLAAALDLPIKRRYGFGTGNTAISKLIRHGGHWQLRLFNDRSHLAELGEDVL